MTASSPDNVAYLKCKIEELTKELSQARGELTEAHEYQTATGDILNVISRSPSQLQPALDAMLQTAGRLCEAGLALFFKLQDGRYHLAGSNNAEATHVKYLSQHPINQDRGSLVGRTALERRTVHLPDCLADPAYTRHDEQRIGNYRSMLGVPLLRDGVPIGVMGLLRTIVKPFTARQIELVTTFADQAVIAIENTRLFNETKEALERQTATAEILRVISSSPTDTQPVFEIIGERAERLCEADVSVVSRVEGELIQLASLHGIAVEGVEAVRRAFPMRLNAETISARTIRAAAVVHVPDVLADSQYEQKDAARAGGYRGCLGVPMVREGQVIGAIFVARTEPGFFADTKVELLKTFADQAVIAIENARLIDEVQARNRDLTEALEQHTATSEVLQVISSSPGELQPVFGAMLASATRLCEASYGAMFLCEGDAFRTGAIHGALPAAFIEQWRSGTLFRLSPETPTVRAAKTRQAFQVADLRANRSYLDGVPLAVSAVEVAGIRTMVSVPMLKDNEPIGTINIYRQEVRPFTDKQVALVTSFANQAVIAIENARLLTELRESLQQQTATADVLKVISRSTLDLNSVLQTLVESAARLCGADQAMVRRREGGVLVRGVGYGYSPEFSEYARTLPIEPGRGTAAGRALLEGKIIHIRDVRADPEYTWTEAQRFGGFRTVLAVPMLREGIPIGVLTLTRSEVRPFTEKQIELVTTFADQAVIAIENVRLFDEVQARTSELSESLEQQTATSEVLSVISSSPTDIEPVLDAILQTAGRLCAAEYALFFKLQDGKYHLAASNNAEAPYVKYLSEHPISLDRGSLVGRTALERRTVHLPDCLADPEYTLHEYARIGKHRSMLGVPLLRERVPIGVIALLRTSVKPFTDKQIELVTTFADQAVIAIENVRLFDEVQARTRELTQSVGELRALGEVSQAVNSTLDLETALNTIVAKAAQLSGTENGAIYVYDDTTKEFALRATYGMSEELTSAIKEHHIGISQALAEATEHREPEQVADLRDDAPSLSQEIALRAGFRARLIVPLLVADEVLGALVVAAASRANFPRARSICCRPSAPNRRWRSRMRACSAKSRRKADSSNWRASTSRNSSPT